MKFCTECGTSVEDNVKFCTGCGKPIKENQRSQTDVTEKSEVLGKVATTQNQEPPLYAQQPVYAQSPQQPVYAQPPQTAYMQSQTEQEPQKGSRYAVVSTGGYIGAMLLFMIPVIGWILCIIWACGGTKNQNKRNLAKAYLILFIIVLIISLVFAFIARIAFNGIKDVISDSLQESINGITDEFTGGDSENINSLTNMLDELKKSTEGLNNNND